jgi:hypothetical protein
VAGSAPLELDFFEDIYRLYSIFCLLDPGVKVTITPVAFGFVTLLLKKMF